MAAINAPRLVVTAERPSTTGSWDDLISRNRARSRQSIYAQGLGSESDERRRAQGENRLSGGISEPRSPHDENRDHPAARPRRMVVHHPNQRTSRAFAAHVAALNSSPSPLSMSVSSDALPKSNPNHHRHNNPSTTQASNSADDFDSAPPIAHQPRQSMYARSPRQCDVPAGFDPAFTFAPRPSSYQAHDAVSAPGKRGRIVSWGVMPSTQEDDPAFQMHQQRGPPARNSTGGWQRRPELIKHFRIARSQPNEVFNRLPTEVLRLILHHLQNLHLQGQSTSCATCWMRNCCAVSMCNKKMLQVARAALYEHIQLVGAESPVQKKRYKHVSSTRLVLLRRSLRADHKLAELVRTIKVPALSDDAAIEAKEYHDVVASVIMACPNLERLDGFYPTYDHSHSRLFNALASRAALKEMTWIIDAPWCEPDAAEARTARRSQSRTRHRSMSRSRHQSKSRSSSTATQPRRHTNSRGYLIPDLANQFVLHHTYWKELTNLTIHCLPGANLCTPNDLIAVVTSYLPSLKTLCMSHVPARSFDDQTLLALPKPLTKLSLTHCPGVTASGLAAYASGPMASALETLTLLHQDLDSMAAVVRILFKLPKLTKFNLVQTMAPKLPDDTLVWLMPYLASPCLKTLHWDILESGASDLGRGGSTEADDILARSIMANGFPSLTKLRVPQDPNGMFQALCRPNERIDLPGDRYLNLLVNQASANGPRPVTAAGKNFGRTHTAKPYSYPNSGGVDSMATSDASASGRSSSETGDSGKVFIPSREAGSDLHQARLAAQARIEAARRFPRFEVNVTDEQGQLIESSGLAGFLGDVTSQISYCLTPDVGGTDEHGGLVGIAELLVDGGEDLTEKGDVASRSGAGYGTGCIAHAYARAQALVVEAKQPTLVGKLTKAGKSSKSQSQSQAGDNSSSNSHPENKAKEGCTGRNVYPGMSSSGTVPPSDKKHHGDWYWHVERGRWRGHVDLA